MQKLQRNYRMVFEIGKKLDFTVYEAQETIEVAYPFTLNLSVKRAINSSTNVGNFQILNLSRATQAKLWKDKYDQSKYIRLSVFAGYGADMPLIFYGEINQCYSYKDGDSTESITEIEANDFTYLFQYGFGNYTFQAGTTFTNMLETLLSQIPIMKVGYVTADIPPLKTSRTFMGQIMDELRREYHNFDIFVDNGQLNVISQKDTIPAEVPIITSDSGMLGTPRRAEQYLEVKTLFEPGIIVGQVILLQSSLLPYMNNYYKVIGVSHQGIISGAESGTLITTLTLFMGDQIFKELKKKVTTYGGQQTTGEWIKPCQGRLSSPFGQRTAPIHGASTFHNGMDIAAPLNTPVKAIANGNIIFAGRSGNNGNLIILDHGTVNGKMVQSLYAHLNGLATSNGQKVSQGDTIGYVGSTGLSTGNHLHLGIKENGVHVNPTKYIGNY